MESIQRRKKKVYHWVENATDGTASLEKKMGTIIIDLLDLPRVLEMRQQGWGLIIKGRGYIQWSKRMNDKMVYISFHRWLLDAPDEMDVDHHNHKPLDNRRGNLRLCTHQQNQRNRSKQLTNTASRYKGVSFEKTSRINPWKAHAKVSDKYIYLGLHPTELAAARAYNAFAQKTFGEFALVNNL